ncbi:unnamed protein product, partial [Ixodes pacificus]
VKKVPITHGSDLEAMTRSPPTPLEWFLTISSLILVLALVCLHFQLAPVPRRTLHARVRSSFYGASNVTGFHKPVVPNVVHFIRLNQTEISFWDAVCIRSVYLNQNPTGILVHCSPCELKGRYASWIADIPTLQLVPIEAPESVFGLEFGCVQHVSDVLRIRVLMEHGGIYLDNDVFVVRSMNLFRHYEMSLGWPRGAHIGNQILIAHPKARFLPLYHELYRRYNKSSWYWNAGNLPTLDILRPHGHLVHRSYRRLAVGMYLFDLLYVPGTWPQWRKEAVAVHLFVHHRGGNSGDPLNGVPIDENNVLRYDTAAGQMARSVLFGTTDFVESGTDVLNVSVLRK